MAKLSFTDWYTQEQAELLTNFAETNQDIEPDFNLQVAIEIAYQKYLKQEFTISDNQGDW